MVGIPSTTQAVKFSRAKNISSDLHCNDSTNLLSLATSANAYLMSRSFLREYRLNIATFLWDYSHIVPLNQIEVTSETWTSIIPFSGFRRWWCNIRPSLRCPCTIDWQFSRPARLIFPLGALSTNWKYPHSQNASWNDFRGTSGQALPLPSRVSLSRACSFLRTLLPSACYPG